MRRRSSQRCQRPPGGVHSISARHSGGRWHKALKKWRPGSLAAVRLPFSSRRSDSLLRVPVRSSPAGAQGIPAMGRDPSISLFSAIGRFIYVKRMCFSIHSQLQMLIIAQGIDSNAKPSAGDNLLVPRLARHARPPLEYANPEVARLVLVRLYAEIYTQEIIERCDLTGDSFTAFLHENYPAHFSDLDDLVCLSFNLRQPR